MRTEPIETHPRRPPSEVEWEDLLYRLELMTRALRVTLEDAPETDTEIARLLRDAVRLEAESQAWIEGLATDRPVGDAETERRARAATARDETGWLTDRFVSLRLRSFAMIQRRGLVVWDWAAPYRGGPEATLNQVLSTLASRDAALLEALRARLQEKAPAPC